jgi:hypothetical protein
MATVYKSKVRAVFDRILHRFTMSDEDNQALTPAEHAELLRRFPRFAYWVGGAVNHPDIHPQGQVDNPAPGSFVIADFCPSDAHLTKVDSQPDQCVYPVELWYHGWRNQSYSAQTSCRYSIRRLHVTDLCLNGTRSSQCEPGL